MDTQHTLKNRIAELETDRDRFRTENAALREQLGIETRRADHNLHEWASVSEDRNRLREALEHASRRLCHNIDCDCEPDRMMYRRALSPTGEHPDTAMLEKRVAELEAALEQIGNVLGPGTCAACQCEGCAWEAKEAVRLAISALAHTVTHSHSPLPEVGKMVEHPALDALKEEPKADTPAHCCGASGFGKEWPGEPRDICPACEAWAKERRGEAER